VLALSAVCGKPFRVRARLRAGRSPQLLGAATRLQQRFLRAMQELVGNKSRRGAGRAPSPTKPKVTALRNLFERFQALLLQGGQYRVCNDHRLLDLLEANPLGLGCMPQRRPGACAVPRSGCPLPGASLFARPIHVRRKALTT
jgi:hypothetical protein